MALFTEIVHDKCMAFADRIVKLNDFLLMQTAKKEELRAKKEKRKAIPIYLHSVANICNQLLRAGTSIGANNAEAINAISKSDYADCEELVKILVTRCEKLNSEGGKEG